MKNADSKRTTTKEQTTTEVLIAPGQIVGQLEAMEKVFQVTQVLSANLAESLAEENRFDVSTEAVAEMEVIACKLASVLADDAVKMNVRNLMGPVLDADDPELREIID